MADFTRAEVQEIESLLAELESDEIQRRLRPGFETDFANSVLHQWPERRWLSVNQIERLREIVARHRDRDERKISRRYEGF